MHRRQRDVLRFIIKYKTEHDGVAPTHREIIEATDITSLSIVNYALMRLERLGKIRLLGDRGRTRSIAVVGATWTPPED